MSGLGARREQVQAITGPRTPLATRFSLLLAALLPLVALLIPASAGATVLDLANGHAVGIALRPGITLPASARPSQTSSPSSQSSQSSPPGTLAYHNGPVVHASTPYLIFWTPSGESIPAATQALMKQYFGDVAAAGTASTNIYAVGRQYTDGTGFANDGQSFNSATQVIVDSDAYPSRDTTNCPNADVSSAYPTCLTDTQIESELTHLISADHLPTDGTSKQTLPSPAPAYFVVLPSDVNECLASGQIYCASDDYCAYHSSYSDGSAYVLYGAIPTIILNSSENPKACQDDGNSVVQEPNGSPADVVLKYLGHEDNELITDPFLTGWYDNSSGNEEGDDCNSTGQADPTANTDPNAFLPTLGGSAGAGTLYDQIINGDRYYLQSMWSNGDGACEMQATPGTVSPSFTTPSAAVAPGSTVTLSPAASTSTFASTSASWNFGDGHTLFHGSGSALSSVSHSFTSPGTYSVSLTLVDNRGNLATTTEHVAVYSAPSAAFATSPSPVQNAPVQFDGSSSSDPDAGVTITSYAWSFGDGSTQTTATPQTSHDYSQPGTYTVGLTVTNSAGVTNTVTHSVVVDAAPNAVLSVTPSSPLVGQSVSFSGAGSAAPGGSITSYSWNFGDGSASSGSSASASHTYTQAGNYLVTLTVTDSNGHNDTASEGITVGSPPSAAFDVSGPPQPAEGSPVSLDASASSDPDAGVSLVSYAWDFGDGTTLTSSSPSVSHMYSGPGTYTVRLTVTNSIGLTDTTSQALSIAELPSAVMTATPGQPKVGQQVTFDGAGSTDPNGHIVSWSWNFGDGSGPASGTQPVHTYTQAGDYTVSLTVTDSAGLSDTQTQEVIVGTAPTASFSPPATAVQGSPASFQASAGDSDSGVSIASYSWSFGDSSAPVSSASPQIAHTYAQPGTYTVSLTVTNSIGLSTTVTAPVAVAALPQPSFTAAPSPAVAGSPASFDGSASSDSDGTITGYTWNFGDGTPPTISSTAQTAHTFAQPGTYTVTLTVTDSNGYTNSSTQTLTVDGLPQPSFVTGAQTPLAGTALNFDASGSLDPNGAAITGYRWSFGDGSAAISSTTPQTAHTFAQPGAYTVTLTTTDALGLSATTTQIVQIYGLPAPAFAAGTGAALPGSAVLFDAATSSDPNGLVITGYRWDFGDGASTVASTPQSTHAYAQPGTYVVTLTTTDSRGLSATVAHAVTVHALPGASFTASPAVPLAGTAVGFDAGASSDPNGVAITSYTWNYGDGATASGPSATGSHVYGQPGTYTVTLTTIDALGLSASHTSQLTVDDAAPTAAVKLLSTTPVTGLAVSFSAAGSQDADGGITGYVWSFGDGTTGTGPTPAHSYRAAGTYTVTLTVLDSTGQTATATTVVRVAAAARVTAMSARNATVGPLLLITVSGAGELQVGKHSVKLAGHGIAKVQLRLTAAQQRTLRTHGLLKLRTSVRFTPRLGVATTQPVTVVIRRTTRSKTVREPRATTLTAVTIHVG